MSTTAWDEFTASIKDAEARISARGTGAWYRGHRNGNWRLTPTLLRSENGVKREETLFAEVQTRGAKFVAQAKNDWEIAALMQHHGVPTRLLDWTESLYIALYFAISGYCEEPCIWIANPFLISAKSTGGKYIYDYSDDSEMKYKRLFASSASWPHRRPVAISSPWSHRRIENQKGFFTVHGQLVEDLDEQMPRFVKKISMSSDVVEHARGLLSEIGLNAFTIFHDFENLAKVLREKYSLD